MFRRMTHELLSPAEMAEADRRAIAAGPFDGIALMRNAGQAVASLALARYPDARRFHVLCGPGNNGGDGYVVARLLHESGTAVSLWASGEPRPGGDAAIAAAECPVAPRALADFAAEPGSVIVDALYGAGLSKPLTGEAARAVEIADAKKLPVVAVDLPSGVSGDSGMALGSAFRAQVTVTFARKKPGHLLLPGRILCGEVVLADIGISDEVVEGLGVKTFENTPALWLAGYPGPDIDTHKYRRGHVERLFRRTVFHRGSAAVGAGRRTHRGRGGDGSVAGQRHAGECRAPDFDHAAQGGRRRRSCRRVG